tara:strand:+ start:725 stop:1204 length:480 start_codon:yes stop_codon:yes gene_type:complete
MEQLLKDIHLKHDIWIDIVKSFGCKHYYAEDIVQEMYIKIIRYHNKGLNIDYGDKDFNYYYIFLTLKTLYFNLQKKENKVLILNIDDENCINEQYDVDFEKSYNKVLKELNKMYWYDKKVYELLSGNQSIANLSRRTNIPYHSLYNTYRKVIEKLKKQI